MKLLILSYEGRINPDYPPGASNRVGDICCTWGYTSRVRNRRTASINRAGRVVLPSQPNICPPGSVPGQKWEKGDFGKGAQIRTRGRGSSRFEPCPCGIVTLKGENADDVVAGSGSSTVQYCRQLSALDPFRPLFGVTRK
ncbi:Hypothetical protein NTJ_16173 [Nesidiocoris tenuis]|uniref:Uncharacterized protein n=1 Tax=Nesidiocoris tenuis TaxID=355587 RepID=A0ABN7BH94_9HEMI|nr:Hypothetical protein NTJ_16173 [Nesidiocoris tenuis]